MKVIRKKWLLPIVVFAIAIAGAFASNSVKNIYPDPTGYIDAPLPCKIPVTCVLSGGTACTNAALQPAFGWNSMHTACNEERFKP